MKLRVYSTWFGGIYDRLAKVWEASVRLNSPGATIIGERSRPPDGAAGLYRRCGNHVAGNTHKLGLWLRATEDALNAGEHLVLMDADTIVLRDLSEAFSQFSKSADVAYTTRDYRIGFNAGVVFLRPTVGALRFVRAWHIANSAIVSAARNRRQATAEGRGTGRNYGGANQYALSRVLKKLPPDCEASTLPCNVWNSVDQTWEDFGPHTGVVHLKGTLRSLILDPNQTGNPDPAAGAVQRIVAAYRAIEAGLVDESSTQPQEAAA